MEISVSQFQFLHSFLIHFTNWIFILFVTWLYLSKFDLGVSWK